MMGDVGDFWRDVKEAQRAMKAECPKCLSVRPRANPSKLLPGQRCKVCGYVDPRKREGKA